MPQVSASPRVMTRSFAIAAAIAGAFVVATIGLWVHYGSVVFYEMILAGIAACF